MSDRRSALVLFPHGIGDIIMATPSLRVLYDSGYIVDMMVRSSVIESRILDDCPYTDKLIKVRADTTENGFNRYHMPKFRALASEYDWCGISQLRTTCAYRVKLIANDLNVLPSHYHLEVWISPEHEAEAASFAREHAVGRQFVYVHTCTEVHRRYWWNSLDYVRETFPGMSIIDSGEGGNAHKRFKNINVNFALMRLAKHRVLSLSVMAAAADAMQLPIDILNSEIPNHSCLPMNKKLVTKYRIKGVIR